LVHHREEKCDITLASWQQNFWITTTGNLNNNDSDSNENIKKAIGLISKTTTLLMNRLFILFLAVAARL